MSKNRLIEPNAKKALEQMKHEIANELGTENIPIATQNGEATSRQYGFYGGPVGGAMTKKLVEMGERQLMNQNKNK